ncbi:DUF4142 domain-containing protein [Rhodocista pekingensis]|uniref:DUF4142 domain-containing protein n=2 Tax=Rhodocista pekingensis TaxID=201185 RepID=A0ABW2KNV5_9PROT
MTGRMGRRAPALLLAAALAGAAALAAPAGQARPQGAGAADPATGGPVATGFDATHLQQAYQRGLGELAQAELALSRTTRPELRALAQAARERLTGLNGTLAEIARRLGVTLPTEPLAEDRAVQDRLATLEDPAFQDGFLRDRAQGLMRQVNTLEKLAAQATDPALRDAAAQALPGLDALRRQALDLRVALAPVGDGPVGAVPGADRPAGTAPP